MLGDAAASHASAEANAVISVGAQWVHLVAAGVWIGGLGALLLTLSAIPAETRSRVVERFSVGAVACLLVIAATGALRAVAALGSWSQLFATLYGALVIAKVGLVLLLALLGAVNRVNSMRSAAPMKGFWRIGSTQLVAGIAVLVLSAALVNVAPPSAVAAATRSGAAGQVLTGTDGGAVNGRLVVSPGHTGFNHFTLTLTNFANTAPVTGATVNIGFVFLGRVSIGASTLTLVSQGSGVYTADGPNLSLDGIWSLTAAVREGDQVYDVPFQLTTGAP
jgi:copper transport protein